MINKQIKCDFPCTDINKDIIFPKLNIDPNAIKLVMISEAPPVDHSHYFYKTTDSSFFRTTQTAFHDAGYHISNYDDLTKMGIYLTTAIKCSKQDYLVSAQTIKNCSKILEQELFQFPHIKMIMCMGDFAIKVVNCIFKEKFNVKPIKSGSTYKIRKEKFVINNIRFFPSYTHTGDSFNLEQSKRRMIAEDIKNAMNYL